MTTIPTFQTDAPHLSEATLTQLCAMARRYVLAGGGLFPNNHDDDRTEHIGNADRALHPTHNSGETLSEVLATLVPAHDAHEELYSAAWKVVSDHSDAAFVFGALVGLEFAGLMLGRHVPPPSDDPRQ
jgi:hypothetical protein